MWVSDRWRDFEVLAASDGERLERWGEYILIRPDPQVIWHSGRNHRGWKDYHARYHRSSKGGGSWEVRSLPEEWGISYGELKFLVKPFSFKHTGIFPEQAANWDWMMGLISGRKKTREKVKILNLFAYTGGATIAAAKAGANVTHVDSSKGMVGWARENAKVSSIPDNAVRWLVDDCPKFIEREIRRRNSYDAIILDPPSYGRGPKGEIWKLEDSIYDLLQRLSLLLSPNPLFFILNAYTTGLQAATLKYMLEITIARPHGGSVYAEELGLPVDESGLILPCGAAGRVVFLNRQ
ncbi:MAG: class I SAM-dependent methyltransferase [Lachnospiraceae bacterium]|nr:class I SAM-dependent methyltransferase [Lachnospiraceae bacterium]